MEDQRTSKAASAAPQAFGRSADDLERKKAFLIRFLYAAVILAIAIFICRKAISALLPFVIALVVALLLKPLVRFLNNTCHVHKNIASVIVVMLFYALLGMLLILIGAKLIATVRTLVMALPDYYNNTIEPLLYELGDLLQTFLARLDPVAASTVSGYLASAGEALEGAVSSFSMTALKAVTGYAISMPALFVDIIIMIIATVFITTDFPLLKRFILCQFPEKTQSLLHNIGVHLSRTLGQYIRSYALIVAITFVELCIGLSLIGVQKAPLLSLLIAVFDILPVVGCGTVLIPWTIISFVLGDFRRAIFIGILYVVITVIRNVIEPKIIGNTVGLHPIVTLSSMVVGVYVFGGIGLLGLPITLALFTSLNNAGVIHVFRYPDDPAPSAPDTAGSDGDAAPQAPAQENA